MTEHEEARRDSAVKDVSIVLPADAEDQELLSRVVSSYADQLDAARHSWEILLVPNVRGGAEKSPVWSVSSRIDVRVCSPRDGWGAAVSEGLRASTGRLLCYTNWRRTSAVVIAEILDLALRNQDVVIRANRRTRDTRARRVGSLLFNLECRFLLQVPAWDINGTPKVFPRRFDSLLALDRADDLFDAEFAVVCERAGYPVIEVPVEAALHPGLTSAPDLPAALRMYLGVAALRSELK